MALICRGCGSDKVATGLDRNKCLDCGTHIDQSGQPVAGGLVWTSEVTDSAKEFAGTVKAKK